MHENSKTSKLIKRLSIFLPIMVKRTIPIAIPTLLKNRRMIVLLIILSVLLGIIPTLKTDLESGIIDQANSIFTNTFHINISDIFGIRLQYFSQPSDNNSDIIEKAIFALFHGITLGSAFGIYLFIIVVAVMITYWSTVVQEKITARIFTALRAVAFQKSLSINSSNLPSLSNIAGQYSMGIHQGADNVSGTYGFVLEIGQYIFSLITIILLVATKSLAFAGGCLIVVALQVLISFIQARKLAEKRESLDEKRNDLVARSEDILSKREIILAYEQEGRYTEKLKNLTKDYAEVVQNLDIQEGKYNGASTIVSDVGRLSVIILSLVLVLLFRRQDVTSIGDMYFLILIYTRILDPVSNILYRYDDIKRSEATSKTFLELLQDQSVIIEPAQQNLDQMNILTQKLDNLGIRFVDISFRYKDDKDTWVLRNCSFQAPANKTTLIVGRSGSGKSTIARILLGFWPVNQGEVYVDGTALNAWDLAALREMMSYVAQGDHIIDDSVRDNLSWAYTKDTISDDRMLEVLMEVGIIKNVKECSILEQPARNLSGGQQQRLSIARMLLDESPIVILDEPLTGVDVFTLHELLPVLDRTLRRPNRTVVMFSHNLVLASHASHIVVLGDEGKVAEEGEIKQLLTKKGGIFATLYQTALDDLHAKRQ